MLRRVGHRNQERRHPLDGLGELRHSQVGHASREASQANASTGRSLADAGHEPALGFLGRELSLAAVFVPLARDELVRFAGVPSALLAANTELRGLAPGRAARERGGALGARSAGPAVAAGCAVSARPLSCLDLRRIPW